MPETAENNCGGGRIEEIVCEDRISALPKELLLSILVLIPTKDAVATMILSKRWLNVWTMLPKLEYKENNDDEDETKKSVWWFLKNSMELHKAPVLETLCMELGPRCPSDANFEKFVAKAVDRRVLRLELDLRWPADLTRLPKSLYTCKTLVDLTLSNKILVDFPCYNSCFPSLTHLFLHYVVYEDEASLVRLLSSCPVLERLSVKRRKDDNVTKFCVKVPTLWFFLYENYNIIKDDDDKCLVMDTMALTNFCIADYSGDSCSIKNMPCVEDALIDILQPFPYIDEKFLNSFSSVLSLELVLTDDMIVRCSNIKFSQLIKFKIYPCDSDWMDSLVPLLTNTPKLKYLIVDYRSTHQPPIASATWRERGNCYPECLYSSLEKFELIDYGGREEEEELVEYILSYSMCLKTAIIYLKTTLEHDQNKDTMVEELKALYMYSTTCRLLFQTNT